MWPRLDGWADDDHAAAFRGFPEQLRRCCAARRGARDAADAAGADRGLPQGRRCRSAQAEEARAVLRGAILADARSRRSATPDGFLTGYYEPIVEGSRVPTNEFTVPLYRRPRDLVPSGASARSTTLSRTGRKVERLAQEQDRALSTTAPRSRTARSTARNLEICWLKDPIEAFCRPDPGLGARPPEDGTHSAAQLSTRTTAIPTTPVGRILIERKIVSKRRDVDGSHPRMDGGAIRTRARSCGARTSPMCSSASTGLAERRGTDRRARRAADCPAARSRSTASCTSTARRSSSPPICRSTTRSPTTKFRRLMVAQDTGSCDRRAGARRHLFRRRRRGRAASPAASTQPAAS